MDNGASSYQRFLEGDRDGFARIVYDYYDGLVLYLNTWLNNLHDAEDMAQETLVVLVSKKPVFTGKSTFKTWLYSVGRNVTVDYLRKNHRVVTSSPEDLAQLSEQVQEEAGGYFADEEKQALHKCLMRLKPEYRRVLWLKYFEDMSAAEIAAVMGKSVFSVNHLVKRGKKALSEEMDREGYHARS